MDPEQLWLSAADSEHVLSSSYEFIESGELLSENVSLGGVTLNFWCLLMLVDSPWLLSQLNERARLIGA